ncbi:MAG TPA: fumarylacetoacetate hydrolase family protein [Candidatus Limnocylindrales bacterium]|nr:fumarylacetoacetate hydrolase family protein [Candidatus Limnocylindrales bacterium]
MRLATIVEAGRMRAALVRGDRFLPIVGPGDELESIRAIAAGGWPALETIASWAEEQPAVAWRTRGDVELGPVIPDPGAIYTIGDNYRPPEAGEDDDSGRPTAPLVYGKASTSVAADGATLAWDRAVTDDVDGEVELGIVIGAEAWRVPETSAMDHVFGFTIVNDISSRDARLDGDQWLLGKSMPGFCPVGPVIVSADELDATDLRLGCTINGEAIQDGRTSDMRFSIAEIVSFITHHLRLRPGDLIATGTPVRLSTPPGPDRRLQPGDTVTCWIKGIGELTTHIA